MNRRYLAYRRFGSPIYPIETPLCLFAVAVFYLFELRIQHIILRSFAWPRRLGTARGPRAGRRLLVHLLHDGARSLLQFGRLALDLLAIVAAHRRLDLGHGLGR